MGEESLDRAVEQAIMAMKKGSHLLKCGRRGKPKFCPFRLSTDEKHLIWYSGEKEKQLRLSSVTKIIPGQRTVNFQKHLQLDRECQSFSLVYANNERSLDLICKDKAQADSWFIGLKTVISRCHHSKLCNGSRSRRGVQSCINSPAGYIRRKYNLGLDHDNNVGYSQVRSVCASPTLSISDKSFHDSLSYCSESLYGSEPGLPEAHIVKPNDLKRRGSSLGRSEFQSLVPDRFQIEKIDDLKDVLIWGEGVAGGALGHGFKSHYDSKQSDALWPRVLESAVMLDVDKVCLGAKHAGIVAKNGDVFTWGDGAGGRLGHKVSLSSTEPKIVDSLTGVKVKSISCGEYHTCALTRSGEVYTWGDNGFGPSRPWPIKLSGPLDGITVKSVACGEWHTAVVSTSGRLFTYGDGTFGVLGHGDSESAARPREVESLRGLVVKSVACGPWHTAAIVEIIADRCKHGDAAAAETGKLFTWGDGDKGRLGHGNTENKLSPTCVANLVDHDFVQVSCGRMLTVGLTDTGIVYTMGSSVHGQLGNPAAKDKSITIVEGSLKEQRVKSVSSGSYHVAVLTSKGKVYTWGKGQNGQLGLGDTEDRSSPMIIEALSERRVESVACGSNITAAISFHRPVSVHDQSSCTGCKMSFGFTRKKHNCYNCGLLFCRACSGKKASHASLAPNKNKPSRVCDPCFDRLQSATRSGGLGKVESQSTRQVMVEEVKDERHERSEVNSTLTTPRWGHVRHSWLSEMDFSRNDTAMVPFHKATSPRVLSETSAREEDVSGPDRMLVDEVRRLRAEARILEKQYQVGNTKLRECQERVEEAWSVARDEAAKCKAAKEIIKALALQIHTMSEKRLLKDGQDVNVPRIAPIRTESNARAGSTPRLGGNVTPQLSEVTLPQDYPAESLCGSPIVFSNTLKSINARDPSKDNAGSVEDARTDQRKPQEWVKQYEPGVYITFTSLPTGQTGLKRVRFSRKKFSDKEATKWWEENQGVVCRKYGIEGYSNSDQNQRNG